MILDVIQRVIEMLSVDERVRLADWFAQFQAAWQNRQAHPPPALHRMLPVKLWSLKTNSVILKFKIFSEAVN